MTERIHLTGRFDSSCQSAAVFCGGGPFAAAQFLSRPVVIVFSYDRGVTDPIRWARLHLDFPLNSKLLVNGEMKTILSGDIPAEQLLLPLYKTFVVTSCFYSK